VAFHSFASNLVWVDTNGALDIFIRDLQTGATDLISLNSGGGQGNGDSGNPRVSADGRYVAFESLAVNLVAGDTNLAWDAFVRDRQAGTTERMSVNSAGDEGNRDSALTSISGDGRIVAFTSDASNLVPGDANNYCDYDGDTQPDNCTDIFVHDRQTAKTQRASVATAGTEANDGSYSPSLTADGRYVGFESDATNLVAGDTNFSTDVFFHDLGDGDADGQWDPFDNCPGRPNADQSLPDWPVPADDSDCDGFAAATEQFLGTAPPAGCPATGIADGIDNDGDTSIDELNEGANDENPDPWPPDANDDQDADIGDLMQLFGGGKLLINSGNPLYQARSDFTADGDLDVGDIPRGFKDTILKRCV
jgi:hypothetical protein